MSSSQGSMFPEAPTPLSSFNHAFVIGETDEYTGSGAIDGVGVPGSPATTSGSKISPMMLEKSDPDSAPPKRSFFEKILFCFTINTYKPYFDVDTVDVYDRIIGAVTYFNVEGGFRESVLERNGSGPDLYGPFWIATTLVFFVAVSSNLSIYIHTDSSSDFEYDIAHIGRAMSIIYSFVFILPTILSFALSCLAIPIPLVDLICLYGYSLVPFLPASFLCTIPFNIVIWLVLFLATGFSMILIMKNVVKNIMQTNIDGESGMASWRRIKDGPVFGTIMGCHISFLLVLKFSFYHHHWGNK